jgi:phospholipid/cholesterol/gamma-HCH transport system substrate-binding protein
MESEAKYILVGSFVLISVVLIIIALFWVSDISGRQNVEYYTVYFKNQNLSGLQKDSWVTMKGIKVGTVANYRVSPRNIEEVKVMLRLDRGTPIKMDTSVVIRRNLLTGIATIDLVGTTQDSPRLTDVNQGESYPVIPEGRSELEKITETIPGLLEQMNIGVNRIVAVFSEENVRSVGDTLKNINSVSATLAENRNKIQTSLTELERTLQDIRELTKALNSFAKNTDQHFGETSKEASSALKEMDATLKNFNDKVTKMSSAVSNATQVFAQEVTTVSQNISAAANTFSKTMENFENPRKIIAGPNKQELGPGEKLGR